MVYVLVQNRTTVLLGPMTWKPRLIQSELTDLYDMGDLTVEYTVPQTDQGYINIGDGFEIFPVVSYETPGHHGLYQELAGPFWTYDNNEASATFQVVDKTNIEAIKGDLQNLITQERYAKEQQGTTAVVANGVTIALNTDRDTRAQYVNLLNSIGSETINYKSNAGFIQLTSADLQIMVSAVNDYVQAQFDWELETINQIASLNTLSELKAVTSTGS